MKHAVLRLAVIIAMTTGAGIIQSFIPGGLVQPVFAQPAPPKPVLKGFPFTNESLSYTVNWPSGLTLGEAHLSATGVPSGWRFELGLDASIPGFAVKDAFHSSASADLCSETFSKDSTHGSRKNTETVTIDPATSTATRTPGKGDGVSKTPVPACLRDALDFLFYARREMGQGRVPVAQEIDFGAIYNGSFDYAGAETIPVGGKPTVTDKIVCHIKGPASDIQFDAYFDRDPARTPVSIRVPLALGKFSLELVR
jgi:Protein of unknown function (DUF3108)